MLTENGEVLTFGDGSVGQLGRCSRVSHIRSQRMVNDSPDSLRISVYDKEKKKLVMFDNIMAGGFWTAARSINGAVYVCGLNNFGQLGVPTPEALEDNGLCCVFFVRSSTRHKKFICTLFTLCYTKQTNFL